MPKFFVRNNQIDKERVVIIGEDVKHISNVLRMKIGDEMHICDIDTSTNYLVQLKNFDKEKIIGIIVKKLKSEAESNINITIFQGIPKSDKMELIIQKSVELGIKEITPVDMERCVSKITAKDEIKKIQRWQKISEVASKQAGRDIIPKINEIVKIKTICENIKNFDMIIVPYERENEKSLKNVIDELKSIKNEKISIGIVIGPEGGFSNDEIEILKKSGAKIITLGKRILRTETVALAMTSIIMYELGGSL